jgi:pimeloyl-ACP methyl ester carboxylesterase
MTAPAPASPATPSPAAAPRENEVRFDSDGITLAGTFTDVAAPVAAVLIVTGSGKINRDSDVRGLKIQVTRAVAQALAQPENSTAPAASLRYDKRGIGASGGDYRRAGMADNLADARAGLDWLAGRLPGVPLLVAGHSEGTLYAAQLAASDPRVAGAVLLAAPARSGERIIDYQIETVVPRLPPVVKAITRLIRYDIVRGQHKRVERLKASTGDVIRVAGVRANARWWRDFLSYDPSADLARITVPVLAITGGHDLQVPPEDVDAIGRLVRGPFEGHVAGDLSHLLRPDPKSVGPRGYRREVRQPVNPEALDLVTAWVSRHWGPRTGG